MPFAMAWPEVYRQVIQHSNQNELKLMHLHSSDNSRIASNGTDQTAADYSAKVDIARFEAYSSRTDLGRKNSLNRYLFLNRYVGINVCHFNIKSQGGPIIQDHNGLHHSSCG